MENNEITTLLQSPTFWFATVFVSLLVSMLGSFLYNLAQKMWAFFSKKQADKNKAKQKAFENLVMEAHKKGIHTSELEIHSIYTNLWNMLFLIVLLIVALFINSISNGSFPFLVTGLIVWALLRTYPKIRQRRI